MFMVKRKNVWRFKLVIVIQEQSIHIQIALYMYGPRPKRRPQAPAHARTEYALTGGNIVATRMLEWHVDRL